MNRRLLVGASVVVVLAGAAVVFASVGRRSSPAHPHPAASGPSEHGNGMDHAMSAILVMYKAPAGNTPCESAYNAFKASQDYAAANDATAVVLRLAPRDEFLQRCAALPPLSQQCMVPAYLAQHRQECAKAKPAPEALSPMIELKQREEGTGGGPDEMPTPKTEVP